MKPARAQSTSIMRSLWCGVSPMSLKRDPQTTHNNKNTKLRTKSKMGDPFDHASIAACASAFSSVAQCRTNSLKYSENCVRFVTPTNITLLLCCAASAEKGAAAKCSMISKDKKRRNEYPRYLESLLLSLSLLMCPSWLVVS